MRKSSIIVPVILLTLGMLALNASAQAPNTILYQGRLTNADGAPLQQADVDSVHFTIYTEAMAVLYDTAVTDLTVDINGVFTVELGPLAPPVFSGAKRLLGIKVNMDPEMGPPQPLTSAPYAMASNPPEAGAALNFQNINATLSTSATMVDSVIITVPSSGSVIVQATGSLELNHSGTGDMMVNMSLSKTTSFNYSNQSYFNMGTKGADIYYTPFISIMADNVPAAGTYKYYLLGYKSSGVTTATAYRCRILATYYPTSYGTVEESKSGMGGASEKPDME